ncbi:hypothetical protein [Fodinibius sp.]
MNQLVPRKHKKSTAGGGYRTPFPGNAGSSLCSAAAEAGIQLIKRSD